METPPTLPPGCSLRGRTLHLDLDRALAHLGVDGRGGTMVMALHAARYLGLSVTLGGDPQVSPAGQLDAAALDRASGALLELSTVTGLPDEAWRLAAVASVWIAAARSLIPSEAVLDAVRRLTAAVPSTRTAHDDDA